MGNDDRGKVKEACKYNAIDFSMEESTFDLKVGAVVFATGWQPYDATRIDNLGFGRYQNIITNMMLERLASSNGVITSYSIHYTKLYENGVFSQGQETVQVALMSMAYLHLNNQTMPRGIGGTGAPPKTKPPSIRRVAPVI